MTTGNPKNINKKIIVLGLPRSGNVFLSVFLKIALKDIEVVSPGESYVIDNISYINNHSISNIEKIKSVYNPVFPLRCPTENIISYLNYYSEIHANNKVEESSQINLQFVDSYIEFSNNHLNLIDNNYKNSVVPFYIIKDQPHLIKNFIKNNLNLNNNNFNNINEYDIKEKVFSCISDKSIPKVNTNNIKDHKKIIMGTIFNKKNKNLHDKYEKIIKNTNFFYKNCECLF